MEPRVSNYWAASTVILSIDSLTATHGEQKLGSSLELGGEVCEGGEDVDRQL